jgi:Tol biopolymer transport system component
VFVAAVACLTLIAGVRAAVAATRYDPRLQFRVLRTPHFTIYWHQGEEVEAGRLAAIAEQVRTALEPELGTVPARVHVILVDQSDLSNGWATPIPWDAIEITARPPSLDSSIGNTTDWLRLVFTHEYTHILHFDRSRGVMRGIRRVFGRVPLAFSNTFLPEWQVEGIATFEESRLTDEGRVRSGDFQTIVDTAARTGRFEPRDRVAGGLDDWPAGDGAYAYGSSFHQYLADRFGAQRIAALRDATAGRLPYFGSGAFRHVFGESLGDLWRDFAASRSAGGRGSATDTASTRLTHFGFDVTALTASGDLFYAVATPDGYPSLMRMTPGSAPVRIAWRFAGDRTTARGDWVVFDQVAPVRSVAWYSDLYAVRTSGGPVYRLTDEARAAEPAFSPDGTRLACVVERGGHRVIATLPFRPDGSSVPQVLVDEPGSDFGGPQWSPDGQRLTAERRRDGVFEIVEIDVASRAMRTLVAAHARLSTPMWMDVDHILFSAELPGAASNVFVLDLPAAEVKRVTDSLTGARFPHVSADGRTLFYVGYTNDGSDVFSLPVDTSAWRSVAAAAFDVLPGRQAAIAETPAAPSSVAYSPWPTLKPAYWTPVIYTDAGELDVGAGTAMSDVLGRHAYGAQAAWSSRARPDWSVSYAYDRWRPTLFASYTDDTDPVRGGEVRSQELQGGALLPFRRLRRTETLFGAFDLEHDGLTCNGPCRTRATSSRRAALQAGWLHDTRRLFGYSISAEEGHSLSASFESTVAGFGSDVDARAAIVDARAYRRVSGQHTVLAIRGAAAAAWGTLDNRRVFSAAGNGPAGGVFSFDRSTIGLLRGFDPDDVVATRAAVANLDLRFPLYRAERGTGPLPVFVRTIHGAAFVDAGTAWDGRLRGKDLRTSTGGELAIDLVLGHSLPITFAAGAAWIHDPVLPRSAAAVFARVGRAF